MPTKKSNIIKDKVYKCKCGQRLSGKPTIFMTTELRVCPKCGRHWYCDTAPIDWAKIAEVSSGRKNDI